MSDSTGVPANKALVDVSSQPVPNPALGAQASTDLPLYTATVSVFPQRVTVSAALPGEKSTAHLFPGLAAVAFYPASDQAPNLLVLVRKTRAKAFEEAQQWSKKWLHRTAALAAWVIYGSYVFASPGVVGRLLDFATGGNASAEWEGILLVSLLAALAVLGSFVSRTKAGLAVLYVLFFPFVALFVGLAQFFNMVRLTRLVFGTLGRFLLRGANWAFLLVACVAVNKNVPRWFLFCILAYLLSGALYIVVTNFIWVTNPLGTLTAVADWVARQFSTSLSSEEKKLSDLMRQYDGESGAPKQLRREEALKVVDNLTTIMNGAQTVADKTRYATGRVVLFYLFTARFLGALFLIVLVFGAIFRGIGRLFPDAFSGTTMSTFWDAFYYSVVTFFTVGDGSIAPRLFVAQAAVVCEVIFAVMTLTVLLLSFSTVSVDVAQEHGRYIEGRAKDYLSRAFALLRKHWNVGDSSPKEFYQRLRTEFDSCRVKGDSP